MARLTILPVARRDIEEIGDFIALDNPTRASSFVAEIERTIVGKVALRPESFPGRDDLAADLRVAVQGRYLIFFTASDDEIRIVRVLHGARDLHRIFDA